MTALGVRFSANSRADISYLRKPRPTAANTGIARLRASPAQRIASPFLPCSIPHSYGLCTVRTIVAARTTDDSNGNYLFGERPGAGMRRSCLHPLRTRRVARAGLPNTRRPGRATVKNNLARRAIGLMLMDPFGDDVVDVGSMTQSYLERYHSRPSRRMMMRPWTMTKTRTGQQRGFFLR